MCEGWECCERLEQSSIVLSEKRSKFELKNGKRYPIGKIEIDGCEAYDFDGPRCDAALHCDAFTAFVELKGNDLPKAVRQLENTIGQFKSLVKGNCYAFAVTSRSPADSTEIQRQKKRWLKKGVRFAVQSRVMRRSYEELAS